MRLPRRSLLLSSSLLTLLLAAPALATTTISTAITTPVKSSTANNGASDDIDVTDAASITLTSGTAITLDSDNTLILNGPLVMSSSDSGSIGILIDGAHTTDLDISGAITVTDDYTASDTDDDDIVDGVFAEGTGRYGIRATGLITGNADIDSSISVEGNQSTAISFEGGQVGDFLFDGSISVLGDEVRGIALSGTQIGQVYISGSIYSQGKDAQGLDLSGAINGALIIDGSVTNTGYRYTSIDDDYLDLLEDDDLYQAKSAVHISNSVSGGVLLNASVTDEDTDNDDENGNGIDDTEEGSASIVQYGSAPALLIGSDTQAISLGAITFNDSVTDTFSDRTYSLDIRGTVSALGVYDGISATGVQIGGLGYETLLAHGFGLSGSVSASANEADATALRLADGAVVSTLNLTGSISSTSVTTDYDTAYGLDIDEGASLPSLTIGYGGLLSAYGYGTTANATALRDSSNTLTSITINGGVSAGIVPGDEDEDDVTDTAVNRAVAVDLRANTVGTQLSVVNAHLDDDDYSSPYITGDIYFGSGDDTLSVSGGSVLGHIDFGAGQNALSITDGSLVAGKLTGAGTVNIDIDDGGLSLASESKLTLSGLHVGSEGTLYMVLSTASPGSAMLVNQGATTFDDGAQLRLSTDELIQTPTRFTLITGTEIDYGDLDLENTDETVPWLYKVTLSTGDNGNNLYADFRLRTQTESGLSANEYGAMGAILTAASTESDASDTLLSATTQSDFLQVYSAFLPDFSGETLLSLSKGQQALSRSIEKQSILPGAGETHYWLQEHGNVVERERGETLGFSSTGYSFAGAVERGLGYGQAVAFVVSYTAATPKDTYATAYERASAADLTLGGYWRLENGGFKAWASAGIGRTFFESERQMVYSTGALTSEAKWNGMSLSGSAGASWRMAAGNISIKPLLSLDYYGLKEDARQESGGGTSFDLGVDERSGHLATGTALVSFGRADRKALIQPELWVGYKQNISATIGDTVARFTGGEDFTLSGGDLKGGAPVVGMRISAGNEYGYLSLEAEAEKYSEYNSYSVSLRTGFKF